MRGRDVRFPAAALVAALVAFRAEGYFRSEFGAARANGMGGAYVAVAEGAEGPFWNPAGLAREGGTQVVAAYEDRLSGLGIRLYDGTQERFATHVVALAGPVSRRFGALGVGWHRLDTALLDENLVTLTFARRLARGVYGGVNWRWMGLALRANEYTALNPDLPDVSASRWESSLDVGVLARVAPEVWAGASGENLRAPRVGFADGEVSPRRLSAGVAYRAERFTQTLDVSVRGLVRDARTEWSVRAGVEYHAVRDRLTLRAGSDLETVTAGLSIGWDARAGARVEVHYAALFPTDGPEGTRGSHQVGMSVGF
jgi:hypothetical protein